MTQLLQARDISLDELHTQFGLQRTSDKTFFPEWQEADPELSDFEQTQLRRVQENYLNITSRKNFSEEAVKMVVLSPLLDLAGFYQAPFALKTEESVEIEAEDNGLLVTGEIDVLVIRQSFWVLALESKNTQFDVLTALPQALTYMLGSPNSASSVYGLLVNGREFVFIKLTNHPELKSVPIYDRSYTLSIERDGDLEQILKILKVIQRNILVFGHMNSQLINRICEGISGLPRDNENCPYFIYKDENLKKYNDLISKLGKQWGDKYSRKYIEKILRRLINKFTPDEREALKSELQAEDLEYKQYDTEQTVYIPVDGINLDSSFSIKIGKVTFVRISSEELKNLLNSMTRTVKTMQHSDEEKKMILAERDKYMEERFLHRVCSKMSIVAEPEKAYEIAVIETSKAFEVLRYSIPCFNYAFDMSKRFEIGFLGNISLGRKTGLAISPSGFYDMWRMSQAPLNLGDNFQDKFEKIGVLDLSTLLRKTNRTEFEDVILRFLHWISDSYIQIELENRLLSLIIALETLFGSGPHATGFGAAILIKEELDQRREVKNRVAKLYHHRNNVAHGSKKNNVEDKDVDYLIMLTMDLMIKMLELVKSGTVISKKDLQKIIEVKQLS